jgi:tetratricopeptide (TPR) repeat protein
MSPGKHPVEGTTHRKSRQSYLLDVIAAILLTCSVTMLADFSRRLLGADPDSLGIVSVSVQAVFAVAATGTFTKAGWEWIESALHKLKIGMNSQSRLRFGLAAVLLAIVCPAWIWLPARLAQHYNARGLAFAMKLNPDEKDMSRAFEDLQRSIALDPQLSAAQFNLGELFENSYQFDVAASHYQQAIQINPRDVRAYNNLARMLLMSGNFMTALRAADQGIGIGASDAETKAALYENRAAAEYELGFYKEALADANVTAESFPNAAAPYCLMGKIYAKTGVPAQARAAWREFEKLAEAPNGSSAVGQPDCIRLSEESDATN